MKVHFDEHHVKVYNKDNKLLLVGHRDPLRNLYMISIEENGDGQPRVNVTEPRVNTTEPMVPRVPHALMALCIQPTLPRILQHQAVNDTKLI